MVAEANFIKLDKVPQNFNVIRVEAFQKVMVKDQIILMLKDPIEILYDHLVDQLGEPSDISKVIANFAAFDLDQEIKIPSPSKQTPDIVVPSRSVPVAPVVPFAKKFQKEE